MRQITVIILFVIGFSACIEAPNQFTHLPPGQWRGILKLADPEVANTNYAGTDQEKLLDYFELPFNFDVEYVDGEMVIHLINGDERILVEGVYYGRDPATAKDTLQMNFKSFDTKMDAYYEENIIEGYWNVNYKKGYSIPFMAEYGRDHRFVQQTEEEPVDYGGSWQVEFEYDTEDAYPAIAEFKQDGINLSGTFLTETGDYRYLDGNVIGDKLRLSVFDGAHAFLFRGSMQNDTIFGEFRSGKHYKSKWRATRTSEGTLKDPYAMTGTEVDRINTFSFQDTNGEIYELNQSSNDGKIKLINIMGTWCPNCKDEISYLKQIQKDYPADKLEIVSLAFERYREEDKAIKQLQAYKKSMDISWPLLYGGYANKKENSEQLDFVDKIYSYPTLLVLDESNAIVHIHTGFNGPATSRFEAFDIDFRNKLDELIQ